MWLYNFMRVFSGQRVNFMSVFSVLVYNFM